MSRNGSGTHTIPNTFSAGAVITSAGHNQNYADLSAEITNSLALDGQSTMTGQLKLSAGTLALPGLTFSGDLDTGFYRVTANSFAAVCAGTAIITLSDTAVTVSKDTTFSADVTVGDDLTVTDTLSVTGVTTLSGGVTVSGAPIKGPDGTVGAPGLSFSSDLDTGFYRIGANNLGIAAGGGKVVDVSAAGAAITGTFSASGAATLSSTLAVGGSATITGAVTANSGLTVAGGPIRAPDGTAGAPGIAFDGDLDTGVYRISTNNVGIAAGGTKIVDVSTNGAAITGTFSASGAATLSSTLTVSGAATVAGSPVTTFPAGTTLIFQQTSAPTGWTKQTSHDDKALRLVSGSVSSGGNVAFSTVFAKTATDGKAVSQAELPSVNFSGNALTVTPTVVTSVTFNKVTENVVRYEGTGTSVTMLKSNTDITAGSDSSADITGNVPSGGSGTAHIHDMDIRVQYVDVIAASKD